MSSKIKVLPDHLINQIAAGEVVEEAASALKELLENALDAGSKRIVVTIEKGGYQLLSVVDDGCGMAEDDAVLCFERHATSKIRAVDDLIKLSTMGFRGEALAAIAAVSKTALTTALPNSEERGTKVEIAGGRLLAVGPCGRTQGTSIEVRNLFYNAPARRKFQPSQGASEKAILRLMTAFALGHPNVEFVLQNEEGQLLYVRRIESSWEHAIKKRAEDIFGQDQLLFEQPVQAEERGYSISGFLGPSHLHRAQRSGQYLFVEGRYVTSPLVSRSVREAFSTRLPEGRHPLYVLYLRFPSGDVDVNVHPQKKEVRFRDEAFLNNFIQRALQKSFLRSEYTVREGRPGPILNPSRSLTADLPVILPWEMQEAPEAPTLQDPSDQLELPCEFNDMNIIGLYDKYLIAGGQGFSAESPLFAGKKGEGMVLIDLSLARMRVAYEEFLLPQDAKGGSFQRLLIPCKMQLSKPEAARLEKRLADLRHLGLEIQIIGEREILIEGMSSFWEIDDVKEAISASLDEIEKETIEKNLLHRLALRASGFARWNKEKGGLLEARALLKRLMKSKDPYFSPRGKPIMALLDERILERLFYGS